DLSRLAERLYRRDDALDPGAGAAVPPRPVPQSRASCQIACRARPRRGRDPARRQDGCRGRDARAYRAGARRVRALRSVGLASYTTAASAIYARQPPNAEMSRAPSMPAASTRKPFTSLPSARRMVPIESGGGIAATNLPKADGDSAQTSIST